MTEASKSNSRAWRDKIPYFLLVLLCFFPIMPFGVMSVAIIAFSLSCVVCNHLNFAKNLKEIGWKPFVINIAFLIFLAVTALYSENTKNALVQLQKGLPLIVLPMVLFYFPPKIDRKRLHSLFMAFIIANLFFVGYLFHYLVNNASDFAVTTSPGLILFEGLKDLGFFAQLKSLWDGSFYEALYYARETVESKLYIHKTYASQNLLWCVLIVLYILFNRKSNPLFKLMFGVLLALLTLLLIYFYSLTNLLLFLILVPLYIFFSIASKKVKTAFALLVLLIGIGLGSFINTSPKSIQQQTYEEYVKYEHPKYIFGNIVKMFNNDDRNGINKCNRKLIASAPFLGHGLGDVQDELNNCYNDLKKTGTYDLDIVSQNLNPHNYYALLWVAGGIFALLAFVFALLFNFWSGFRTKDLLYIVFLLLVALNLFTESTLSRAHGILFFALWNSLLLAKNLVPVKNDTTK